MWICIYFSFSIFLFFFNFNFLFNFNLLFFFFLFLFFSWLFRVFCFLFTPLFIVFCFFPPLVFSLSSFYLSFLPSAPRLSSLRHMELSRKVCVAEGEDMPGILGLRSRRDKQLHLCGSISIQCEASRNSFFGQRVFDIQHLGYEKTLFM